MSREPNPSTSALKLALTAQRLRAESGGADLLQSEPIAIIGLGCRFPGGASTPEKFWRLLESGTNAVREIPPERWDIDLYYDPDPTVPGKMSTRWAGLLDQVDQFDAEFFGIAPREAAAMDPQQRLLLEVAWETLNDAGRPPESLNDSSTGVFFALYNSDYARLQFSDPTTIGAHTSSGTSHGVAAGRLSYLLNLHGPSMAIDTACSSSLVAIHLACQSLRAGECSLALAGGVSALITPEETVSLSKWGMLAPDGRCKTFDAAANGFVRGEGCGIVALKRLADALADGDRVLALVRGSAVNQDGRSAALTAPNGIAQEAVLRQALKNARVMGAQLSYVEAHGTGTALGDPIEVEALAAVVGAPRPNGSSCRLGSVKTNLGHLEAASGVAGLIKVVLAMQHHKIPPHLHFKRLNPLISLEGTCLAIGGDAVPWPLGEVPRCAGVSSFGFGGTNAHVVLEEAPQLPARSEAAHGSNVGLRFLPISARNGRALAELAEEYAAFLSDKRLNGEQSLGDLCHTASLRRWHYPIRAAFVAETQKEMAERIRVYLEETPARDETRDRPGKLAFVFSGHGSQWVGMGQSLLEGEPVYREALTQCDTALRSVSGWSVLEELNASGDRSRLEETEVFQPVLFAIQVALATLWQSWGIVPEAVLGHSVGEIAAAHVAGVIGLDDAAKIVVHRGRSMQAAAGQGGMAAVEISAHEAKELIVQGEFDVTIAAINGPRSITLSGSTDAIDRCLFELSARGIQGRRLKVNCAFHSPAMFPFADALVKEIAGLSPVTGTIPLFSTVDGRILEGRKLDRAYWRRNICEPVQFAAATAAAIRAGYSLFLEISPHPVLSGALKQCLAASGTKGAFLSSMRRGEDESATMLTSLGSLYTLGRSIQWKALHPGRPRCVSLPPYPWQRERHWAAHQPATDAVGQKAAEIAWPGRVLRSAFFDGVLVECEISPNQPRFVNDHRVCGTAIVPATAMIDLALTAARQVLIDDNAAPDDSTLSTASQHLLLENFAIDQALVVPDKERRVLQLGFKAETRDSGSFQLFSRPVVEAKTNRPWTLHGRGSIRRISSLQRTSDTLETPTLDSAMTHCREPVDLELHYQTMWKRGVEFGPLFQGVDALWRGTQSSLARIRAIETADRSASREAHPALLDACLQAIAPNLPEDYGRDGFLCAYLPLAIDRLSLSENLHAARWSFARLRAQHGANTGTLTADVWIFDDAGQIFGQVQGLRLQRTERSRLAQLVQNGNERWVYRLHWDQQPLPLPGNAEAARFDKRCLIFADRNGIARRFAEGLTERGIDCLFAEAGERFGCTADGCFKVAPARADDFHALLKELRRRGQWPIKDVVHFWGLDLPPAAAETSRSFSEEQVLSFGSVLHLVQALNSEQAERPPRIWLVSRSAVAITGEESVVEPTQAPVWGLGHVINLEHPEYRCTKVDLQGDTTTIASSVDQLCDELCAESKEDRVALSNGRRFVARLQPLEQLSNPTLPSTSRPPFVTLQTDSSGVLEQLRWRPGQRRAPETGEVEIEVDCAGLNFRDVLIALNMVTGRGERLGGECAGRVVSVGKGVRRFREGDEVIAFALGGLASYVTVSSDLVIEKPSGISLEQSAVLPIVFLTALYAFRQVTALHPGQKVLIHAAAGGVGFAAVQLAKLAGAEIFGTAGNPEKRALVESWGVHHVFDSRSLSFADKIRAVLGEGGIDVVLNSLSGEFASQSLKLVRPGGAFIELGKRDLLDPQAVQRAYPGVSYTTFDLADVSQHEPLLIRSLFEELKRLVESGAVTLPPMRVFPAQDVAAAFRQMAQGHHVGKILIRLKERRPHPHLTGAFAAGGTWVITGGLGGLGLQLARWLLNQGVSRVALIGRSSPDKSAQRQIEDLRSAGASVEIYQADVTDRARLEQVFDEIRKQPGPLQGVVHAAGVLDDGTIAQMDWPRSRAVLSPKLDGAWNLHQCTLGDSLEAFVLFSSGASILGSPGQGNYAAANAFMDALAHYRHAQGLPALSINWGAWGDAGMTANLVANRRERLAARGLRPIALEEGFSVLGELLSRDLPQIVAVPADWSQYIRQLPLGASTSILRSLVVPTPPFDSEHPEAKPEADLVAKWAALPPVQRLGRVRQFVEAHASRALGIPGGKSIDSRRALHEMGLDSLMSVELRNALAGSLRCSLSATLVYDYPTIESLSHYLAKDVLRLELGDTAPPSESMAAENEDLRMLQEISESEAESLLLAELDQFKNAKR